MDNKSTKFSKMLEAEIVTGKIPAGYRIPAERELAVKYSLSHMTVNKAVAGLVAKGLLVRKGNHGTFVAEHSASVFSKTAALLFDANPEHHNPFLSELPRALQREGYNTLLIDTDPRVRRTHSLGDVSNISTFIAHTSFDFPLDVLSQLAVSSRLILIEEPINPPPIPFSSVIPDFRDGAFKGIQLLVEAGHDKIVSIIPEMSQGGPRACLLNEGVRNAQTKLGIKQVRRIDPVDEEEKDAYFELFKEEDRPDAVFAHSDFHAMLIIKAAKSFGLKVPEDVAVVGYGNTPWAESFNITTFSLEPDKISEAVLMLMNTDPGLEIRVKPRLILKGSAVWAQ